ncbi:hypothetical protein D3C83_296810 [compost metagenome]
MPDHDVGMQHAVATDFGIVADKHARVKRRVAANFGAGTDIDMRENRHTVRNHG